MGHAVRLLGDGRVEVQRDTSLALGEGTAMPDIMPAVAGMITAVVPQFTSKAVSGDWRGGWVHKVIVRRVSGRESPKEMEGR